MAAIDVLVVLLLAAAGAIAWTGGGRLTIGELSVSARSWPRPLIAAALLFGTWHGLRLVRQRTAAAAVIHRLGSVVTAGLTVAALAVGAASIIHACGGLDSHGYVAFSKLLSEGQISRPMPDLSFLPVDRTADIATPLGFIPSADGAALVPEFPPGLPLMMTAARLAAGDESVFWVAWISGVALVLLVFLLARYRYGATTGALGAALMAAHPVFAAYTMQAMSDVPATLWMVLAVYCLFGRDRPLPALAGIAGSMALLTRPPLMLPVALLALVWARHSRRQAITMAAWALPGLVLLMVLQQFLFGNALVSGHGSAGRLFTTDTLAHNLAAHGKWFLIVHTPLAVPALWLGWRSDRPFGTAMAALAVAAALPYFFYGVRFDDWEMLRFLLPGLALLVPVAAEGVIAVLRRIPFPTMQQLAVAAIAALAVIGAGRWLEAHGMFALQLLESKYPRVGTWLTERTPPNALVLASLHSGSAHYYSGRLTLRWDAIPPERFAGVVAAAGRQERPLYAVLDGVEMQQFERRFTGAIGSTVDVEPLDRIFTTYIAEVRSIEPDRRR